MIPHKKQTAYWYPHFVWWPSRLQLPPAVALKSQNLATLTHNKSTEKIAKSATTKADQCPLFPPVPGPAGNDISCWAIKRLDCIPHQGRHAPLTFKHRFWKLIIVAKNHQGMQQNINLDTKNTCKIKWKVIPLFDVKIKYTLMDLIAGVPWHLSRWSCSRFPLLICSISN